MQALKASPTVPSLIEAWKIFAQERSIVLHATSMESDYKQTTKWLSRCPVQELSRGREVMAWVFQQKPAKSARRVSMYVKSLYRWASSEDIGYLIKNPITNFRMPKAPQSDDEIIVIPRSEMAILMAALSARERKSKWSLYAEFMLQTAMRTGEVRAMRWSDISDGRVTVHSNFTLTHGLKDSTKTNKKRSVPLNARCEELLASVPVINEYVFPYNRYTFQSFFYERSKELLFAGLISHRYRPYDLRHTAISRWIENGIPVAQVSKWAGNSSEVIWKHYASVTKEYEMPVL